MSDAREITRALGGKWWRGGYGLAFCPAHANTRTPALTLKDGRDGRLLAHCFAGCTFEDVATALRGMGLLDGPAGRDFMPDPAAEARRKAEEARERAKRIAQARALWTEAEPIAGTLGERYLRARGIRGEIPASLRFAPTCWHKSAKRLPAMVAAVMLEGEAGPVAVHRTYLAEPGRKADVEPAKAMLGPVAGGAVRLLDGTGPLVAAEGIETALTLAEILQGRSPRVLAALSTSGMSGLALPSSAGELVIAPDGDAPGAEAAEKLATRAWAAGWSVRILPPPGDGLDWNDVARREGAA